jgi:hypothetical protein
MTSYENIILENFQPILNSDGMCLEQKFPRPREGAAIWGRAYFSHELTMFEARACIYCTYNACFISRFHSKCGYKPAVINTAFSVRVSQWTDWSIWFHNVVSSRKVTQRRTKWQMKFWLWKNLEEGCCSFIPWLTLQTGRWWLYVPPKRLSSSLLQALQPKASTVQRLLHILAVSHLFSLSLSIPISRLTTRLNNQLEFQLVRYSFI